MIEEKIEGDGTVFAGGDVAGELEQGVRSSIPGAYRLHEVNEWEPPLASLGEWLA